MTNLTSLTRHSHRAGPRIRLTDEISLPAARVHEACGRARRCFAMMLASKTAGHIYWITPAWLPDQLNCEGVRRFIDPARITHLHPGRPEDVLWCMEEILRSGAVPLVVADIPGLPGLTQVRRMHLAAERGLHEGICQPVGLLLTPGAGGAQGVESRWQMEPDHKVGSEGWSLERVRARTAPQKRWRIVHQPGADSETPFSSRAVAGAGAGFIPAPADREDLHQEFEGFFHLVVAGRKDQGHSRHHDSRFKVGHSVSLPLRSQV